MLILGALPSTPIYALMIFGVVLALMGHIFRDYRIVGIGLAVLFIATGLLFIGAHQAYEQNGPLSF